MNEGALLLGGAAIGAAAGMYIVLYIVWYLLQVIADWRILAKAGRPGWLCLVPLLNVCSEYGICWSSSMGIAFLAATALGSSMSQSESGFLSAIGGLLSFAALLIHIIESLRLAKAFGKGIGFGILLILFGPITRIVLGFGSSRYYGNPN